MSSELVTRDAGAHLQTLTREQVELVKNTIAKGATDDELALFINQVNRTGLDPFARQIYSIKRSGERTTQVSIDGARLVAERTGQYRPGTTYYYDAEGKESTVWLADTPPVAARVTVFKDDHEVPGIPVKWSERVQSTPTWKSMPATMLGKCAEMATLRQAFPQELSGLYSPEEIPLSRELTYESAPAAAAELPEQSGSFAAPVNAAKATKARVTEIETLLDEDAAGSQDRRDALDARMLERYGTTDVSQLTKAQADELLELLKGAS